MRKQELAALIGRLGPATGLRPAGAMAHKGTKRQKTRAARNERAIAEQSL